MRIRRSYIDDKLLAEQEYKRESSSNSSYSVDDEGDLEGGVFSGYSGDEVD